MISLHLIGMFNCDVFEHSVLERKVGQTSKEGGLLRTEALVCANAEVQPTHKILFVHHLYASGIACVMKLELISNGRKGKESVA